MYNLPYHKENNEATVLAFVEQNPFAILSGCNHENKPVATQIPIFIERRNGKKVMRGHMMRKTDHHKAFEHNSNVLAIFSGKHTYVSGSWYSDPNMASTWNYMSVHAKGNIRFLGDEALEEVLRKTSLHFEGNNADSPAVYDNLPISFKKRVIGAIVAFEIEITDIDTVFKLSQDRDQESYENIIQKLKNQDADGRVIAEEMQKRKDDLFGGLIFPLTSSRSSSDD